MSDTRYFDLSFHEDEDRILMVCRGGGGSQAVWLTRRIIRRVLEGFGMLLLRSSPAAARAPASLRTDVIVMEHQAALTQPASVSAPGLAGRITEAAAGDGSVSGTAVSDEMTGQSRDGNRIRLVGSESIILVTKIDVQMQRHAFTLFFYQGETVRLRTSFSRTGFHRLLSALDKLAQRAGWDVEPARGWLAQVDRSDRVDHAFLV